VTLLARLPLAPDQATSALPCLAGAALLAALAAKPGGAPGGARRTRRLGDGASREARLWPRRPASPEGRPLRRRLPTRDSRRPPQGPASRDRRRWPRGLASPDGHRRLAFATVALTVAMTLAAPRLAVVALVGAAAALAAVRLPARRAAARRRAAQAEAAPAVLDLLGAGLLAGLNPHLAILRVAERAPDALRDELAMAASVVRLGGTPGAAGLRAAADRAGLEELRAAAAALEAAERWGAPPAEALAARASALRSRARLRAEADAGRAAVRLAFPLVFCFLPAFVLLTVVPTVAGALRTLTP
jgi:Flp pilus assembly protein TadB